MPQDVWNSPLRNRDGFWGGLFRLVSAACYKLLHWLVLVAPLLLFTWIGSFLALHDISRLRLLTTVSFGWFFVLCVGFHLLELVMAVPLRDSKYPVVLADPVMTDFLIRPAHGLPLSLTTGLYASLLWISWWNSWQDFGGDSNTLIFAGVNTVLAGAMFLYGRWPPYYFFRKPSLEDIKWLRNRPINYLEEGTGRRHIGPAHQDEAPTVQAQQSAPPDPDYATPVAARSPRMSFKDIFGMNPVKERLLKPAQAIIAARDAATEAPGNGILMHGEPGNGKTAFAEALAGELGVPLVTLTYGDISSKWLGEMPRLIFNSFAYAKAQGPCVFFIDEVDSFLRSRDSGSNNSEDLKMTNTFLTELVAVRQHRVVLVAATNYLSGLDAAAIREGRFDFKVEITPPDEPARIGLLQLCIAKYAGSLEVDQDALVCVAKRWNGFSVSRLLAIGKSLPEYAQSRQIARIGFEDWMAALRLVQGRKGRPPAETKSLADLVLEAATRDSLELVASRLKDVQRIEAMGGTLPTGILLHGPSGTGKTAAARALALECGWAFIAVAGPDLLAERDRINKVYAEAMDLRPTLLFIDEADDVLRDRQFTSAPDLVNRLLVLMDGAGEKIKDVVLLAATNHPGMLDSALLRAGRFTEKVEFFLPPADQVPRAIAGWLKAKGVTLELGNDAFDVAGMLGPQSMANIEGILQHALNRAIPRTRQGQTVVLTSQDIKTAVSVVAPCEDALA